MTSRSLDNLFSEFNKLKAIVIGDVMIDSYYWGQVERISPEAPVPIVSVTKIEERLGGAANVALNIQALGAIPILCSVIGDDADGQLFLNLLDKNKQTKRGILQSKRTLTTKKTRIIGNRHQMLRVDAEDAEPISEAETQLLFEQIKTLINEQKIDVVIFEDYDKGAITPTLIESVVELCNKLDIPTSVDPKKRNFNQYMGVDLFKPNLKELAEGLKVDVDPKDPNSLKDAIHLLHNHLHHRSTLLTLSEHGILIDDGNSLEIIKAHARDITDVSGAGDTVISVASLLLALKASTKVIAELSNLAGGLVCEKIGVVPIDKQQLLEEAKTLLDRE